MTVVCGGRVIAADVRLADSFFKRFRGLMGRKSLAEGEALLLIDCPSVHCFFMKMTIDAVYLSKDMTVLFTETLRPWSVGRRVKGTAHVLELAEGEAKVAAGQTLIINGDGGIRNDGRKQ